MSTLATATLPVGATAAPLRDVVCVCGTTGVGKSQLAVALAQSLRHAQPQVAESSKLPDRAVVLSADSMQLYKGLDVITNKVTREEQGGVEHWGLDMVTPGKEASWELGKWCSEADRKARDHLVPGLPSTNRARCSDRIATALDARYHLRGNPLLYAAFPLPSA